MEYCAPCDRSFNTYHGYQQHINNSAAHSYDNEQWECEVCDRSFATERARHQHYTNAPGHHYCVDCQRMFMNENNLRQHLHSRTHVGSNIGCPFCLSKYTTASGLTIHLESGTCSSGLTRTRIKDIVQRLDQEHIITRPLLTSTSTRASTRTSTSTSDDVTTATERAWNGRAYECSFCTREYRSLPALDQHMRSPAHEEHWYRCPGGGCARSFALLSALVQHVESERCGLMRFATVQEQARGGIERMVGRMIRG